MVDQVTRMVLLPRYTAVYGDTPVNSAPFNVRGYAKVVLMGWAGRGLGASAPDTAITIEQSADLAAWHTAGGITPSAGAEATSTFDLLDLEWARVKVDIDPDPGEPPGNTVWAVGSFVLRDGVRA